MTTCRIVIPDVDVLPLSDGDSITVKRQLSSGEERRMIRRGVTFTTAGERQFDPIEGGVAKILAYLVDWTFRGPDGRVLAIRDQPASTVEAALDLIDPDSYAEVLRAIEGHERTQAAARAEKKTTRPGGLTSSATSPSPVAAAGVTTGS